MLGNFAYFNTVCRLFLFKKKFWNTQSVKQFESSSGRIWAQIKPDLGPNLLQMLRADDKIRH